MLYRVFGLNIDSEIEIPQLQQGTGPAEVRICLGKAPQELEKPFAQTSWYSQNDSQCLISIDGVADFFINSGETITIEVAPQADAQAVNTWLLGSAIAALLHQRQILPLHASAIETNRGAVLIAGDSGAGKSTTAAGFLQQGYRLIADDVSAVTLNSRREAVVAPAYPQQKLWQDALDHLSISSEELDELFYYQAKYALPRLESFCDFSVPVHKIYILCGYMDKILVRPVNGMAKLTTISSYIYRPYFMSRHLHSVLEETTLVTLATQATASEVWRPKDSSRIGTLIDCLLSDLAQ